MSIKRILTIVAIFISGLAAGIVIAQCPISLAQSVLYKAEAYFSPDGGISSRIVKAIDASKVSIDIAIFNFTSRDIRAALERAKERHVRISIIADSKQAENTRSVISDLTKEGFDVKLAHGRDKGIMHNKFAIFDGKLLVTGSFNWTYSAERFNYENAIFTTDPDIIALYQKEFNSI